jgi:hypothetical protein
MKTFTTTVFLIVLNLQSAKAQCEFELSLDEYLYVCSEAQFPMNFGASMILEPSLEPYTFYWDCFYEPFPGSEMTFDEFDFIDDPSAQFPNLIGSIEGDTIIFVLTATQFDGPSCSVSISVVTSCWNIIMEGCDLVYIAPGQSVVLCSSHLPCLEPATYVWSPTTYLDDPTISNPTATPPSDIIYCVEITDAIGCVANTCIDVQVGVGVEENQFWFFECFPNPATDEIIVQCQHQISAIEITDITGRTMLSLHENTTRVILNVESFSDGSYFITTTLKNGILATRKFIKD